MFHSSLKVGSPSSFLTRADYRKTLMELGVRGAEEALGLPTKIKGWSSNSEIFLKAGTLNAHGSIEKEFLHSERFV